MKQSQLLFNVKSVLVAGALFILLRPCFIASMPSAFDSSTPTVEIPQIPQPSPDSQSAAPIPAQAYSEDKVGVQGNWMKKKDWLIKSNEVFDEIQSTANEILGTRKTFNEKYGAIDNEFDTFYKTLSLDQGKLQELFESLERYLEKKKKKKLDELSGIKKEEISEKDYLLKVDLLNTEIKQHKEELDQLKLDLKSIDDLDKSIYDRIKRVDEQIAQAQELLDKARASIEELWNIIDDKKARLIYYDLKGSTLEKLKTILSYLKEDLLRDLDTVIATATTQMNKSKEGVKKLEEKGFFIKNRSQRIEQLKLKELQKLEDAKKEIEQIPTKDELIDLKKLKKQPTLWYEKAYDYVVTITSRIYKFIISLFGFGETPKKAQLLKAPSGQITPVPAPQQQPQIPPTANQPPQQPAQIPATLAQNAPPQALPITQPLFIPPPQDTGSGMPLN